MAASFSSTAPTKPVLQFRANYSKSLLSLPDSCLRIYNRFGEMRLCMLNCVFVKDRKASARCWRQSLRWPRCQTVSTEEAGSTH
ncbi:hypothetical protein ISN45_Aa03g027390 [Arabidopsis thaliana x Arabidopsis arenosa]|uniref:Uncharacterized protein n=1 Tax=Arabidopsis thaliana x Arabidopsis arenosa TaxID=1240361 RepID=A0A8T2B0L4_9BRAS|nr:hypothetical protein ISN45_Aa03g027390 [Arabidopsis thaliana x Arabidopsis arenosa]